MGMRLRSIADSTWPSIEPMSLGPLGVIIRIESRDEMAYRTLLEYSSMCELLLSSDI